MSQNFVAVTERWLLYTDVYIYIYHLGAELGGCNNEAGMFKGFTTYFPGEGMYIQQTHLRKTTATSCHYQA